MLFLFHDVLFLNTNEFYVKKYPNNFPYKHGLYSNEFALFVNWAIINLNVIAFWELFEIFFTTSSFSKNHTKFRTRKLKKLCRKILMKNIYLKK